MIFQHTWEKVLSGEKTQTRRLIKSGCHEYRSGWDVIRATVDERGLTHTKLWTVGHTYAVQPGRGKAAVARIRITDIRLEDVRCISVDDLKAEGFARPFNQNSESRWDFLKVWTQMHDSTFKFWFDPSRVDYGYKIGRKSETCGWEHLQQTIMDRPAERYQAWAITFELVK